MFLQGGRAGGEGKGPALRCYWRQSSRRRQRSSLQKGVLRCDARGGCCKGRRGALWRIDKCVKDGRQTVVAREREGGYETGVQRERGGRGKRWAERARGGKADGASSSAAEFVGGLCPSRMGLLCRGKREAVRRGARAAGRSGKRGAGVRGVKQMSGAGGRGGGRASSAHTEGTGGTTYWAGVQSGRLRAAVRVGGPVQVWTKAAGAARSEVVQEGEARGSV